MTFLCMCVMFVGISVTYVRRLLVAKEFTVWSVTTLTCVMAAAEPLKVMQHTTSLTKWNDSL